MNLVAGGQRAPTIVASRQRRQRAGGGRAPRLVIQPADVANQRESILAGQDQIAEKDVGRIAPEARLRFLRRRGGPDNGAMTLECLARKIQRLAVAVDDEHGDAAERRRGDRGLSGLGERRVRHPQRQPHVERRSGIRALARCGHHPAVQFDHVPHDPQAESEASMRAGGTAVSLAEALEQVLGHLGGEADAGVAHGQPNLVGRGAAAHVHGTAAGRELDRVGQQIPDDLLQPVGVGRDQRKAGVDADLDGNALGFGGGPQRFDGGLHDRLHRGRPDRQLQRARHDAGEIEQVVDQPRLGPAGPFDRLYCMGRLRRVELPAREQPRPTKHGIQRRP